jgi:hypothetical protein
LRWVKGLLDEVIDRHLGYADLEFAWSEEDAEDPASAAEIADTYVRAGIKSVDEVRQELGLAPVGKGAAEVAKYNPNQPRVPAGQPDGGRWASGGQVGAEAGDASGNGSGGNHVGGHGGGTRDTGAMVAAADNVGTMTDADAPAVPQQLAQGDEEYSWQHPSPEEQHRREQAAVEAVAATIAKLPDVNNVFYRGFIYHDADYRYFATDPVPGNSFGPDVRFPDDTGVPKGTNTVTAVYYSHPDNLFTSGSIHGNPAGVAQTMTAQEILFGQTHGLNVYVRTSVGHVLNWDHRTQQ